MGRILYLSQQYSSLDSFQNIDQAQFNVDSVGGVPTPQQVLDADLVLMLGSFTDHARTSQILGVFRLTVEAGTPVVVAFPGTLNEEATVLRGLASHAFANVGPQAVAPSHPAFHEYLRIFGHSSVEFTSLPDDAEVLGVLEEHSQHPPAAWCAPVGAGAVYALPFYLAGATDFLPALLDAVRNLAPALPAMSRPSSPIYASPQSKGFSMRSGVWTPS